MNSPRTFNNQGGYLPANSGNFNAYSRNGTSRRGWQDLTSRSNTGRYSPRNNMSTSGRYSPRANMSPNVYGHSNIYNNTNAAPGHFGMYGPNGRSPAGAPYKSGDVVLDSTQASVLQALQAADPRNQPLVDQSNSTYFNESHVRRIAQALGLSTEGNRTALVAAIKNRVGQMTPAVQQQFVGGLSPRSQRFLTAPTRSRSPSPSRLQTF